MGADPKILVRAEDSNPGGRLTVCTLQLPNWVIVLRAGSVKRNGGGPEELDAGTSDCGVSEQQSPEKVDHLPKEERTWVGKD